MVCFPVNKGMDDSQTHAPPAKRPKQGKGKGGKQPDKPQVPELTEVPTRLETVVKLLARALSGHGDSRCVRIPIRT